MKSTAILLLLPAWAVLLCFSFTCRLQQAARAALSYHKLTEEKLTLEKQNYPVAWHEQTLAHGAPAELDKSLLPASSTLSLQAYELHSSINKLPRPARGPASLSSQFRILPNAP